VEHSEWSPSGFKQIMLCPGSKVLQAGAPRTTSSYAAEGTAAHTLLTWCLQGGHTAASFLGAAIEADGMTFDVDDDMARHVQVTLDYVNDLAAQGGILLVDRRVHFGSYIDQPDEISFGTLDVAVILGTELISIDFKYGMGVEVSAGEDVFITADGVEVHAPLRKPNPQLALYGLGILAEVKEIADIERVRLVISQPRITTKPSEYDLSVEELEAWGHGPARSAVITALNAAGTVWPIVEGPPAEWRSTYLTPGEEQCRFCKAKATCPALRDEVLLTAFLSPPATPDEFESLGAGELGSVDKNTVAWLSAALGKVDLIEDWCKAVRAEVERRLLAGETVPGYKVVQGKMGNRSWVDEKAAQEQLKAMRLKVEEMYDLSLISPTAAEKLAPKFDKAGRVVPPKEGQPAPIIGPRQWQKLQPLITRKQGKPHVAPLSDPRPPLGITPVLDEFESAADDFS
jgi:hypothetical protein